MGVIECVGEGSELLSGITQVAGMEMQLLDDRREFGLNEGLSNGLCDFAGDGVGIDAGLDVAWKIKQTILYAGIGFNGGTVKGLHGSEGLMQGGLEGATFACNKGRGIADKDSEKAHGLGYEEHVIVGAELAKVGNTAEKMGLQIWRKELRDVVEDGFGCLRHGF